MTSQCKILIVPEEGWFGQPKYGTPEKNPSTLCRLLLLFSSCYTWSRLNHYWSNVHQRDHRSGFLLKRFIKQTLITCSLVPSSRSQCFITTGIPMQKCNYVWDIIFIYLFLETKRKRSGRAFVWFIWCKFQFIPKCYLYLCWSSTVFRGLWSYLGLWLHETLEEKSRDG